MAVRPIKKLSKSKPTLEGAGVHLRRAFGFGATKDFDPFLLLDDFRNDIPKDYLAGFPWHPHRGIETITYVLAGTVEHGDSMGNSGVIGAGDIQWMTAGSGIVHQEMPKGDVGGQMHGFQLWVNLPKRDKMMKPRYQEFPSSQIPKVTSEDELFSVKVIAGEAMGQKAIIETRTPIMYLHYNIKPGGVVKQTVPSDFNTFAYVVDGRGLFGAEREAGEDGQMVLFAHDGDEVRIENPSDASTTLEVLLIGGVPLNEPVARYGPFVMNTKQEIFQAIEDYQNGKMGEITQS